MEDVSVQYDHRASKYCRLPRFWAPRLGRLWIHITVHLSKKGIHAISLEYCGLSWLDALWKGSTLTVLQALTARNDLGEVPFE